MKEDSHEFLSQNKIEEIIKQHSDFITFPIYLNKTITETIEVPDDSEEEEEEEEKEKEVDEDGLEVEEEKEEKEKKTKTERVSRILSH